MLKIRSLNKSYANGAKILHVLKNIDLSIKEKKMNIYENQLKPMKINEHL